MNKDLQKDLIFQITSLMVAILLVHLVYVIAIRPNAEAILQADNERAQLGESFVQERSFYVVVRDYEQEACFILMLWAIAIMTYKSRSVLKQRELFNKNLINVRAGMNVLPEDSRELARPIQALADEEKNSLLPKTLLSALSRFQSTHNIQDVTEAVKSSCLFESERLDSELAMVRYIVWAIPSIGFIGTVRGIGEALSQAYKAVEGDIVGVTTSLGVAFNSTFVALIISILLMFLMYQLQLFQEKLVLDTQEYCDQKLITHLQVRKD
ncbi:MotA/TolQ/ExbB proton channel family protein [Gammaproteobacteria bacterium]|nr:MotA/TolQ/ExbB proton channel family protein [Gammaproteobacteria bacterium]